MKSLHKKIGVGALSAALIAGVPMAGASLMAKSRVPVAEAYSQKVSKINVPFLLEYQLKPGDKRQAAENDLKIVFGAGDIYGYRIYEINPRDKDNPEPYIARNKHDKLRSGEEFLGYLKSRKINQGMHQIQIGDQVYRLQFDKDSNRYKEWLLYLDRWQYLGPQVLKEYMSKMVIK